MCGDVGAVPAAYHALVHEIIRILSVPPNVAGKVLGFNRHLHQFFLEVLINREKRNRLAQDCPPLDLLRGGCKYGSTVQGLRLQLIKHLFARLIPREPVPGHHWGNSCVSPGEPLLAIILMGVDHSAQVGACSHIPWFPGVPGVALSPGVHHPRGGLACPTASFAEVEMVIAVRFFA